MTKGFYSITPEQLCMDALPNTTVPCFKLFQVCFIHHVTGGLSLGTLVSQDGENEPLYYDADDIGDAVAEPHSWCRRCRSRSRSRSRCPGI